jgi:hypothetical protein
MGESPISNVFTSLTDHCTMTSSNQEGTTGNQASEMPHKLPRSSCNWMDCVQHVNCQLYSTDHILNMSTAVPATTYMLVPYLFTCTVGVQRCMHAPHALVTDAPESQACGGGLGVGSHSVLHACTVSFYKLRYHGWQPGYEHKRTSGKCLQSPSHGSPPRRQCHLGHWVARDAPTAASTSAVLQQLASQH